MKPKKHIVLLISNTSYDQIRKDKPDFVDIEQAEKDTERFEKFLI